MMHFFETPAITNRFSVSILSNLLASSQGNFFVKYYEFISFSNLGI